MKKILNKAAGGIEGAVGMAGSLLGQSLLEDTSGIKGSIAEVNGLDFTGNTNKDLMSQYGGMPRLDHISYKDLVGSKKKNAMQGLGAVASGASAGSAFGPIGTGVGALVGGIGSLFTAGAKRRKAKREAKKINEQIDQANQGLQDRFNNSVENLETTSNLNAVANIAKDGGEIKVKPSFDEYYKTLPKSKSDTTSYDLRRAYELAPYEDLIKFAKEPEFHLGSVYRNPKTNEYDFVKSSKHPTVNMELDWYNSNDPEAIKFRNEYSLDTSGEYYKYKPKFKDGGDVKVKQEPKLHSTEDFDNPAYSKKPVKSIKEQELIYIKDALDKGLNNFRKAAIIGKAIANAHPIAGPAMDLVDIVEGLKDGNNGEVFLNSTGLAGKVGEAAGSRSQKNLLLSGKKIMQRSKGISPGMFGGIIGSMISAPDIINDAMLAVQELNETNKKADGGMLTTFDNGGSHEENPLGGIPQGIGANGKPNLVEEGETRYDDFIFSDRIYADGGQLRGAGIKGKAGSMAEISKKINKDLKERPNDIISKNTVSVGLDRLSLLQESIKEEDMAKKNKYKSGGILDKAEGLLRYAPVVGSGIASLTDMMGITNKPDYGLAKDLAGSFKPVEATLINDYITYNPLDTEYTKNQLRSAGAANRRAITASAGGNRGAAMAGLLTSDYNMTKGLGDLTRHAAEYNDQLKRQVAEFNRGTNMYNSQSKDRIGMYNSEMKARTKMASAEAKHKAKLDSKNARSANLNNFLTNIGGVGKEAVMRQMISSNPGLAYTLGRDGSVKFKKD